MKKDKNTTNKSSYSLGKKDEGTASKSSYGPLTRLMCCFLAFGVVVTAVFSIVAAIIQ